MTTPRELLETSIAQLQMLKAFLGEQLGEHVDDSESPTPDAIACQEILVSLRELILKAQGGRGLAAGERRATNEERFLVNEDPRTILSSAISRRPQSV